MNIKEVQERHDTKNRNDLGYIIFSDELHQADKDRGFLLDLLAEIAELQRYEIDADYNCRLEIEPIKDGDWIKYKDLQKLLAVIRPSKNS